MSRTAASGGDEESHRPFVPVIETGRSADRGYVAEMGNFSARALIGAGLICAPNRRCCGSLCWRPPIHGCRSRSGSRSGRRRARARHEAGAADPRCARLRGCRVALPCAAAGTHGPRHPRPGRSRRVLPGIQPAARRARDCHCAPEAALTPSAAENEPRFRPGRSGGPRSRRRRHWPAPRIGHRLREIGAHEAGRDDRHAQVLAGLLAQALGDGADRVLRAGVDRLERHDASARRWRRC